MSTPESHPNTDNDGADRVTLHVDDVVIAKIVAYQASITPGIVRLQPGAARALVRGAADVVRGVQRNDQTAASPIDPSPVDIKRDSTSGRASVHLRVVVDGEPAALIAIQELHARVSTALATETNTSADISITVSDYEPPHPLTRIRE